MLLKDEGQANDHLKVYSKKYKSETMIWNYEQENVPLYCNDKA